MAHALHPLEFIRQSEDWTYQTLADKIYLATNFRRDQDCWRRICQRRTKNATDRTEFALQRFLASYTPVAR